LGTYVRHNRREADQAAICSRFGRLTTPPQISPADHGAVVEDTVSVEPARRCSPPDAHPLAAAVSQLLFQTAHRRKRTNRDSGGEKWGAAEQWASSKPHDLILENNHRGKKVTTGVVVLRFFI
jgi:hypothetical protein